jgi:hypothetical protein
MLPSVAGPRSSAKEARISSPETLGAQPAGGPPLQLATVIRDEIPGIRLE